MSAGFRRAWFKYAQIGLDASAELIRDNLSISHHVRNQTRYGQGRLLSDSQVLDDRPLQRLKKAAEKAQIELSSATQTEVNLPFIIAGASGPKHVTMKITRAKLEALVDDLIH